MAPRGGDGRRVSPLMSVRPRRTRARVCVCARARACCAVGGGRLKATDRRPAQGRGWSPRAAPRSSCCSPRTEGGGLERWRRSAAAGAAERGGAGRAERGAAERLAERGTPSASARSRSAAAPVCRRAARARAAPRRCEPGSAPRRHIRAICPPSRAPRATRGVTVGARRWAARAVCYDSTGVAPPWQCVAAVRRSPVEVKLPRAWPRCLRSTSGGALGYAPACRSTPYDSPL